jgi:hypothetical protein
MIDPHTSPGFSPFILSQITYTVLFSFLPNADSANNKYLPLHAICYPFCMTSARTEHFFGGRAKQVIAFSCVCVYVQAIDENETNLVYVQTRDMAFFGLWSRLARPASSIHA